MNPDPVQARKDLRNLLGYAEEILRAGERVISDLTKDAVATFHEHDVIGLEGVTIPSPDGDGGWLRVARLRETQPPVPEPQYLPWLVKPARGLAPLEQPKLMRNLLVEVTAEEVSDLVEAGLAFQEDVMEPKGDRVEKRDTLDLLVRLEKLTDFEATFDRWVAGSWSEWERTERPRRRSIAFYNRLFEIQQRSSSMGDDTPVESVFGVGLARWQHAAGRINAPLIESAVELELEEDGAIVVVPRPQAPRVMLRAFVELDQPGIGRLQQETSGQLDRFYNDSDVGFSPHERSTFEPILRMCHARLASDAIYEPDDRNTGDGEPPAANAKLRITNGWVLYVRQRSANFRCDDIRRLASAIEEAEERELPAPALRMTTRPSDKIVDCDLIDLGGTSILFPDAPSTTGSAGSNGGASTCVGETSTTERDDRAYFFPLPYNDDQIEIVRRLEREDVSGVVVQGPPGTGKTHTIANIVAHYMATGRRVLVSAHQPEALAAIQGKLPESIRDLAISVIHSDREGGRKLEQAVDILASQVKLIDRRAYNDRRIDLEAELGRVRLELARLDEAVREHAKLNLTAVKFRDETLTPMELAGRVHAERTEHAWFSDRLGPEECNEPRFGEAEIAEVVRLRQELGADIIYPADEIPEPSSLPDVPRVLAAHAALIGERQAADLAAAGDLPYVSWGPQAGIEEARQLLAWLESIAAWKRDIEATAPWLEDAYRLLVGVASVHESVRQGVAGLCVEWIALCGQARPFALRGIVIPDARQHEQSFDAAVVAYAEGKKPFGMFSFGKSANRTKELLEGVLVDGAAPTDAETWVCVRDWRAWQRRARAFVRKWTGAAAAVGFPAVMAEPGSALAELLRLGALIERMHELHLEVERHTKLLAVLFPYGVDARKVAFHLDVAVARAALATAMDKEGNADAHRVRRSLAEIGAVSQRPIHVAVADVAASLGDPEIATRTLADAWREITEEVRRLDKLREQRRRLDMIAASVAASGAPNWAASMLADAAEEPCIPSGWLRGWEWARADGHVRRLADRGALAALTARRTHLEDRQRELLGELVRVRTFIGLKQGITERVAAALQKFAMKVRQLGAGTGKAAERHRRAIREATLEAAGAVPCWILPEWRVAEQLPSELARFDLVIIDEASQSDITSLPAVLRGKKLLVVGDDKQVSPVAVGMEERRVVQLRETFLRGMDIANFLEPTTSIYDLASMTFPGSVIMLREHFRCVEPIIAFSSRFYPKALIPLRVPTAEERIDPPLVDVYVPAGRKVRDVNEAEADFIVSEIAKLVAAPAYAQRTIGVISMIGDKQAKLVLDGLVEAVGTEAIARHRIMCGNASTFQGQERDVMFLSLVACPRTVRAQTARLMEQRFNVAMSRARDRMYLVRSVAASMLKPNDLKAAVIEHFRAPMARAVAAGDKAILEETESGFEREVGGLLLERGYRLRPQVQVGGYRLDFVVEGEADRRLAVELDGDRYHGPERWFEDVHRQRALERLGWTFWRCWGSHWLADRRGCLDDLLATLSRLGIEPVGGELGQPTWTEHRVVGEGVSEQGTAVADEKITGPEASAIPPVGEASSDSWSAPGSMPGASGGEVVELGDTVIVRFADDNHVRRFRLNAAAHDPDRGEVGRAQPIAQALLGTGIEEEVDLEVGGRQRRVIVEKITKAA